MKNLSKLGKALNKAEQKEVFGGARVGVPPYIEFCVGGNTSVGRTCSSDANCCDNEQCGPNNQCIL